MFALEIVEDKFSDAACYLLAQSTLHQGRIALVEMIGLTIRRDDSVVLDMHFIIPSLRTNTRPLPVYYLLPLPQGAIILGNISMRIWITFNSVAILQIFSIESK